MIARDVYRDPIEYRDPFELSIEEKIFLGAKRLCVISAGCALILGALDIGGVRSIDDAETAVISARVKIVAFGDIVRAGVHGITLLPEMVLARIPQSPPAKTELALAKSGPSPMNDLAAAGKQDAVIMAMAQPPALAAREPAPAVIASPVVARREPASVIAARSMAQELYDDLKPGPKLHSAAAEKSELAAAPLAPTQLASAEPNAPVTPQPMPVSLPMSAMSESLSALPSSEPIPLALVPLPRAAPGVPPPSPAERLGLKDKEYARAERCLANTIYFEARSEPERGQMAVAQVVMNRVFSGFYPNDVCDVVYQNAHRHLACQFTFACDGKRKMINERGNWARANRIAKQTLDGQIYVPEVAKSTHYHAAYVHPNWVHEMRKLARFGLHSFYRPFAWGNGAEEPVWGSAAMASATAVKKTAHK